MRRVMGETEQRIADLPGFEPAVRDERHRKALSLARAADNSRRHPDDRALDAREAVSAARRART